MIFNVGAGSVGALVHLNITYDDDFIGETITVSNGTETHTFTGDNTLSKVVNCKNLGEWTVSCGESSDSVTVNYYGKYDLELESSGGTVILNLTVYSASNDTIYFYPNNDTSETPITLCTTNASGQGSATLEIPTIGTEITFYSTVAKDTTTGTNAYSKSINLSAETNTLNVMPNGALYWYGNKTPNGGIVGDAHWTTGGGSGTISNMPVWNTNNVDISAPTTGERNNYVSIQSVNSFDNTLYEKVCAYTDIETITKVDLTNNLSKIIVECAYSYSAGQLWLNQTTIQHNTTLKTWSTHSTKVYALWLE